MKIILAAILENISTRSDGSIKIALATQEIAPNQAGELFQLRNQYCKILISNSNITAIEEKLVDEEKIGNEKKTKSQAQRLRGVIFRVHELKNMNIPFEDFYKYEMEMLIGKYKDELNEASH